METLFERTVRQVREELHRKRVLQSITRETKKERQERPDPPYRRYRFRNAYSIKGSAR